MTVQCRIAGKIVTSDSPEDCKASFGTPIDAGAEGGADAGTGQKTKGLCPFVRNVLTRSLADAILDLGASESISSIIADGDLLGSHGKATGKKKITPLTAARKRRIAAGLAGNILTLAPTYSTTIEFRDRVLLTTERGKQLKAHYDHYLAEIYQEATGHTLLLRESASTWLAVYPFVRAMVEAAMDVPGRSKGGKQTLTRQNLKRCTTLIHGFQAASQNRDFQKVLSELETELIGYEGLSAQQAWEKLRTSTKR